LSVSKYTYSRKEFNQDCTGGKRMKHMSILGLSIGNHTIQKLSIE